MDQGSPLHMHRSGVSRGNGKRERKREEKREEGERRNDDHLITIPQTYILEPPREVPVDINSSTWCSCILVAILPPQSVMFPSVLLGYIQRERA